MRAGAAALGAACLLPAASAFPSYIACASDADTPLRVGRHTCGQSNGTKGSDIQPGNVSVANVTAADASGAAAASYQPGEPLTLTFMSPPLPPQAGVWMAVRVSDAGAGGVLSANRTAFAAKCPTQVASMYATAGASEQFRFLPPCDARGDITVTVVYSVCLYGCAPGPTQQPQELYLLSLTLSQRGAGTAGCAEAAAPPMPREQSICQATGCWDGSCAGDEVPIQSFPLNVSRWDAAKGNYTLLGPVPAYTMTDPRWGAFLHGPTPLGGASGTATPGKVPPVYMSNDDHDRLYLIDGIDLRANGSARSKEVAWSVCPASQHHLLDEAGKLKGMVISAGNPYGTSPGLNGSQEISQGGVYAISPTSGCHKLFPSPVDDIKYRGSGETINRVTCHDPSGVCFLSNWEHFFDGKSAFTHCLHWCALNDPSDPTHCSVGAPLPGGPAGSAVPGRFCMEPVATKDNRTLFAAGHGLLIGDTQQVGSAWHMDLIVSYTDGASDLDLGVSFMRKLKVVVDRQGFEGDHTTVRVPAWAPYGEQLWRDTVAGSPYDVRVDHLWRDGKGYVWVSTFGKHNAGEHVMDYDTGALLYSYHGFENASPFPGPHGLYFNPSGVSVVGGFGEPGAVAVVAVESVIPLPTLKAIAFFVDVSALPPLP